MNRWLLALSCICILAPTFAIYEDQVGTTDWYQQYIGQLTFAKFHKTKPRVFVGTQEGILACLNLRDGSIAWRRALGGPDQLDDVVLVEKPAWLLSLSESGKYLRAWDTVEGGMRWETATYTSDRPPVPSAARPSIHVVPGPFAASSVLVWNGSVAQAFDLTEGQLLWTSNVFQADRISVLEEDDKITVVGLSAGLRVVEVAQLSPRNGRVLASWQINFPRKLSHVSVVEGGFVTLVSADKQHLCTAAVKEGSSATCTNLAQLDVPPAAPTAQLSLWATRAGIFLASQSRDTPGGVLLKRGESGLQLHASFPEAIGATEALEVNPEEEVIGIVEAHGQGVKVKVVDTSGGAVVHEEAVEDTGLSATQGALPAVSSALLGAYRRKAAPSDGFRLLLSWQGGTLALVQQGQAVWVREESLASVSKALFLDLPPLNSPLVKQELKNSPVQSATLDDQLKMQILSIKVQFKLNTEEEAAQLADMRARLSDKNRPYRDSNGFRKMIVVLTRSGKLHALHTGNGRILWSRALDATALPSHLLTWRVFHDVEHPPLLLLLHTGAKPVATVVNGHTGEVLERKELPYDVNKVIRVHQPLHDGKADQSLLLLVSGSEAQGNLVVYPFPSSVEAASFLAANYASIFFWIQDPEAKAFTGYGFAQKSMDAATGGITPTQIWRVVLPDPILAVASRDASEPVHSYVKVLGNRSLKYKYLNPNTLFVATGPAPGTPADVEGSELGRPLTLMFLDTVTGRILHRQTVKGGRGPVQATCSENFVVAQYFNTETGRYEMSILELYDAQPRTFNMWDAMFGDRRNESISSLTPPVLEVQSQSYFSRSPLKGMAVTQTLRGITSKQLLLLTASDQVYALHKRFVDPRRPMRQKLTAEEMEEQLVPYTSEQMLFPTQFTTHNKQVANLAGVAVAPAYLESAMHMLAHGTDLFYIRISPAMAYDSLDPDFSYALLLLVLLLLVAAAIAMRYTTEKSLLKEKWK